MAKESDLLLAKQLKTKMKLLLHISDADYRELIAKPRRLRGSIGLISLKEASFNRHSDGNPHAGAYRFRKLRHGRVSITDECVRLTLNIVRSETDICASECIDDESREASDFVFEQIEDPNCPIV